MKYKPEDIKPKRYPDEKPSEGGYDVKYPVLLYDDRQSLFGWNPVTKTATIPTWDKYVTWFIDVPNPPDTLCFLAYPENKPEQFGKYIVHEKNRDTWDTALYWRGDVEIVWDANVDYFIPVRLDKENEMDVIWETDKLKVSENPMAGVWNLRDYPDSIANNRIVVETDELTAFARHWLDLQGYEVTKREPEINYKIENKVMEHRRKYMTLYRDRDDFYWLRILTEEFAELVLSLEGKHEHTPDLELTEIAGICINWLEKRADVNQDRKHEIKACPNCGGDNWLDLQGYDVARKEPEIKACPVCDTTDTPQKRKDMNGWHYVCCPRCDIRTIGWAKIEYAIEAWNALPRKGE